MGIENVALVAFNRGRISRLALARTDIKRVAFSAEVMTNYMARVLGTMSLRAGFEYLGEVGAPPRMIPFIFSTTDTALLEFTDGAFRVWDGDEIVTRPTVTGGIANGDFTTDLSSWTDDDESGGASAWVTGGYMGLTGNGSAAAIRTQAVTIPAPDIVTQHALRIEIERGPVTFMVGTTSGADDLISETTLGTGSHSLTFTPNAATVYVRFLSRLSRQVLVASCNIESGGVMSLDSPYGTDDLGAIRFDQSADVVYLSCYGYQQRKVERRSNNSWSLVRYQANDGPLRTPNVGPITITPSALSGNITLTASASLFKSTQAPSGFNDGALFRITSNGQNVSASITAQNTFTNAITVEGTGNQRVFTVTVDEDGAGSATFTLQRSLVSDSGPWTDVASYTADTTTTYDDGLSNQIAYYRLGVKTGDYGSGTHSVSLAYTVGSIDGFVRVTGYTSATVVSAEVLSDLGGTSATDDWAEGEWSDRRGWPSAVSLYEGRLWWTGKSGIWGSISDGFESFDNSVEGDSGTINREVGSGPLDNINWLLPLNRLLVGAQGAELACKSSSLDEPLTPTNFQIKPASTQGSAAVNPIRIDKRGVYVQNGGTRVFELSIDQSGVDYDSVDMTVLIPEICEPQVLRMAVQRKPDTRVHCILSDGTVAICVFDRAENVNCWLNVEPREGDTVVDAVVLPGDLGTGEDAVYYVVMRSIDGVDRYYLERWALESECIGGTLNKQADSFVTFTNSPASSTVSGLDHLVGEDVVVWADGKCLRDTSDEIETFTVSASGTISLTNDGVAYSATTGVVGLPYRARWKSAKLAYAAQAGTALEQRKKLEHLGLILDRTHHRGIKYGPSFSTLSDLPGVEGGAIVAEDTIYSHYDEDPFEFEGEWDTDSRLCLESNAPRPATVLAAVMPIETRSKL